MQRLGYAAQGICQVSDNFGPAPGGKRDWRIDVLQRRQGDNDTEGRKKVPAKPTAIISWCVQNQRVVELGVDSVAWYSR